MKKLTSKILLGLFFIVPLISSAQTFTTYTSLGKASFTYSYNDGLFSSYYNLKYNDLDQEFVIDQFDFLGYLITIKSESPELKVQFSVGFDGGDYSLLEVETGRRFIKSGSLSYEGEDVFSSGDSISDIKEAVKYFANMLDVSAFKSAASSSSPATQVQHGFDYESTSPQIGNGSMVYLNYPGEMYTTYNLSSESSALDALKRQGLSQAKIDDIIKYSHEDNWPNGINTFSERSEIREKFKAYKCFQIGTFSDKVVLEVPANENKHMSPGMRPDRTIYFIVRDVGIRPGSFYYKEGLPLIEITDPGELYSTFNLKDNSEANTAMRNAGMSADLIEEALDYCSESSWPEGINTLDERLDKRSDFMRFTAYQMAVFDGKTILLIPREGNRHMPGTMIPTNDIYMVIGNDGLKGVKSYFKHPGGWEGKSLATSPVISGSSSSATWYKATIHDSGKLYSTPKLADNTNAMNAFYEAGYSQALIDDILTNSDESRWPEGINTLSDWIENKMAVNDYTAYKVATFDDKYLLYIPQAQNTHMPTHMKTNHDFYMVIGTAGANISSYSNINMPSKYQGPPARAAVSSSPVSSNVDWDLSTLSEVKIVNVGRLYSTFNLSSSTEAKTAMRNQGLSQSQIDDIVKYAHEDNWPEKMDELSDRSGNWDTIERYRVYVVASFGDKVILLIPKSKNFHMPPGYSPDHDFYFVIGDDGVK